VDRGIVSRGADFILPVEAGKTFGHVSLYCEAGYVFTQYGPAGLIGGVACEYELSEKFTLMAEINDTSEVHWKDNQCVFNIGGEWKLGAHYSVIGSAGRSLRAATNDQPDLIGYLGLQLTF